MEPINDRPAPSDARVARVRVFPLPNLVVFPHVVQPLHIFEPRYRELLEDAMADDRRIAMALLTPGWQEDYDGRPPLYRVACLGKVIAHQQLEDGTYNILLHGERRGRIARELPAAHSYREAEVELLDDFDLDGNAAQREKLRAGLVRGAATLLPTLQSLHEQFAQLLNEDTPLSILTDLLAYALDLNVTTKQDLLAQCCVDRRASLLVDHLYGGGDVAVDRAVSDRFPPAFSEN